MSPAVGIGNVLEQPQAVYLGIAHLLEVRDQLDVRKAQPLEPAAVMGVRGFTGILRVGIHIIGTVHAAGAATHHHSLIAFQQVSEADFVDKLVLGGHVPAAEDDPVGIPHQFGCLGGILSLQHHNLGRLDAGLVDTFAHPFFHRRRKAFVVGCGTYQQHAGQLLRSCHGGQGGLDLGQKAVVLRETGFPETRGAAGKE